MSLAASRAYWSRHCPCKCAAPGNTRARIAPCTGRVRPAYFLPGRGFRGLFPTAGTSLALPTRRFRFAIGCNTMWRSVLVVPVLMGAFSGGRSRQSSIRRTNCRRCSSAQPTARALQRATATPSSSWHDSGRSARAERVALPNDREARPGAKSTWHSDGPDVRQRGAAEGRHQPGQPVLLRARRSIPIPRRRHRDYSANMHISTANPQVKRRCDSCGSARSCTSRAISSRRALRTAGAGAAAHAREDTGARRLRSASG